MTTVSIAEQAGSRRARKKRLARRSIYQAAIARFRRQGFDATSVEQICADADVAKGTFFNYFATKDHVLAAYHGELMDGILVELERLRARSARAAIQRALRVCADAVAADFAMSRIIVRRIFGSDLLLASDRASEERFGRWFADRIQRGIDRGELRANLDVGAMISLVTAVLSSSVLEWVSTDRSFDLAATMARKIDFLFDGVRPR